MAPDPSSPFDPARDAATLLRRLGILTLMIALPLSASAFRIGPVVAFVVGIVLLAVAAAFDGSLRVLQSNALDTARSTAFIAAMVLGIWTALSLVWTPSAPWRQAAGIGAILALGLVGVAALPARMRSANLYPMTVGTGALALVAIALAAGYWGDQAEGRVRQFERTLAILVLFAWPAIAWLRSRGRHIEALALALGAAAAAALGPSPAPIIALAIGALAHLVAQSFVRGSLALGLILAAALVAAPALAAFAAKAFSAQAQTPLPLWHDLLLSEPARLLTGHGLGSLPAQADPTAMVGAPMLSLWYELGVVGVVAAAVAIAGGMARFRDLLGPLAPGASAAVVTAFVLGASGISGGALWWPVALATAMLFFVAAKRGQFRTRRPRALADFVARSGAR